MSNLLDFSSYDPLHMEPRVYHEFAYGYYGDRHPGFEMTVTDSLHERLMKYFDNYPGEHPAEYRYDSDGRITGAFIGEISKGIRRGDGSMTISI